MAKAANRPARLHLLTAREVLSATDGDHCDGGGLYLRVRLAEKSASWVFRYTAPTGKRREMGLGAVHRANAHQAGGALVSARDLAHRYREQLRAGIDPIEARGGQREAKRDADAARKAETDRERWTLSRCSRDYHERVIELTRTAKHAAQWISSLENHMMAIHWNRPISDVTAPQLLQALLAIKPHVRARRHDGEQVPETVRRIRQRLDAVFEDAIFHGRCSTNQAAAIKRKLSEAMPARKGGAFAALDYHAAPAFMRQLGAMPGTAARCLELALLCAARTNDVRLAEWREFDLAACLWSIPASRMKAGEAHSVFLSPQAVSILKAQRALTVGCSLVFPSPANLVKPLSNMAMLAVLDRLGMREQTTVHGLCRATFSTWANETGVARPDVIEACLAHAERDRVRAAYNRAHFAQERRALLATWAEYLYHPALGVMPLAA